MHHIIRLLIVPAIVVLAIPAAQAAEPAGGISAAHLESLGLSGLQAMSADEAMQIRGHRATAWGTAIARVSVGGASGTAIAGHYATGNNVGGGNEALVFTKSTFMFATGSSSARK